MSKQMSAAYIQEVDEYMNELQSEGIYVEYIGMGETVVYTHYPMYRYTDRAEGLLVVDQTNGKVFVQDLITGESGVFNRDAFHNSADKRAFFHANF